MADVNREMNANLPFAVVGSNEFVKVQGHQLNIAVFFWYLVKSDWSMYTCIIAYTRQVTFYKVPEKHGHV